jgi:methylglyoxal/glyoxal reductase
MNMKMYNNVEIPMIGFGTWKISELDAEDAVRMAINTGYRHIDTAAIYLNEKGVAKGIKSSNINRDELFITTKLWIEESSYEDSIKAYKKSCEALETDYVDLFLIHWPTKNFKEQWKALETLFLEKKVRSIGVSNFNRHHLEELQKNQEFSPMANQIEIHPQFSQKEMRLFNEKNKILTEAWSPLMKGKVLDIEELTKIATKHKKTIAQIVLRWHIQNNVIVLPKSSNENRMKENFDIFDFELDKNDMTLIDSLNKDERIGANPDTFASERFNL